MSKQFTVTLTEGQMNQILGALEMVAEGEPLDNYFDSYTYAYKMLEKKFNKAMENK